MLRIEKFQQDKVQLWNNFNKNAKNGLFMFDRNYMDYHSDRFKDNSLIFYEDEKLIALLPCNMSQNLMKRLSQLLYYLSMMIWCILNI